LDSEKIILKAIHHIAIICSNYERSTHFYTEILGLKVLSENFRSKRNSYRLDLPLPNGGQIKLFSFTDAQTRPSFPEALSHTLVSIIVDS